MNQEKEITSMETLRSSVHKKHMELAKMKAQTNYYLGKARKLHEEIVKTSRENVEMEREIVALKIANEKLDILHQRHEEVLEVSQETKTYLHLYNRYAEADTKSVVEKQNDIINRFTKYTDNKKNELMKNSPQYQELSENQKRLKRANFNCRYLKCKINLRKKLNKQRKEIHRKLFNGDIIKIAQNFNTYYKTGDALERLKKSRALETQLFLQLKEAQTKAVKNRIRAPKQANQSQEQSVAAPTTSDANLGEMINMLSTPAHPFKEPQTILEYNSSKSKVRIMSDITLAPREPHVPQRRSTQSTLLKSVINSSKYIKRVCSKYLTRHNSKSNMSSRSNSQTDLDSSLDSNYSLPSQYCENESQLTANIQPTNTTEGQENDMNVENTITAPQTLPFIKIEKQDVTPERKLRRTSLGADNLTSKKVAPFKDNNLPSHTDNLGVPQNKNTFTFGDGGQSETKIQPKKYAKETSSTYFKNQKPSTVVSQDFNDTNKTENENNKLIGPPNPNTTETSQYQSLEGLGDSQIEILTDDEEEINMFGDNNKPNESQGGFHFASFQNYNPFF
ncbi:uncharacterized protein LOC109599223 isoform X2 [Aethina tumida]|uniref:uncharacterized protein LOC109599223 isoform X2 n=1 Tax=Aethina tumida TaxID=116153 RepID=UPI002148AD0B|nr:uncharacterized protein LOC109599223 isoform X2 [Aethina tumida]